MRTAEPPNRPHPRRLTRRIGAVVVGAVMGAAAFAGVSLATGSYRDDDGDDHRDDHAASPPALVERPACTWSEPAEQPAGATVAQRVSIAVRPTALVRLDASGRVISAWTNTGCAPRRSDDVYVERPDGSIRPARSEIVDRRWVGDFREAGVAAVQPIGG